jgi:hypothetical protein
MPFDLELKDYEGNCDLCFLKSIRKKKTILYENPSVHRWWLDMESKYQTVKQPIFDMYARHDISRLLHDSLAPFRKAKDSYDPNEILLFDQDIDKEFTCHCSNIE